MSKLEAPKSFHPKEHDRDDICGYFMERYRQLYQILLH